MERKVDALTFLQLTSLRQGPRPHEECLAAFLDRCLEWMDDAGGRDKFKDMFLGLSSPKEFDQEYLDGLNTMIKRYKID